VSRLQSYDELQGALRALLIMVADQLPTSTVDLVQEMIDANECGVALETVSEMLVASDASIPSSALKVVADLTSSMDLEQVNVERLLPHVRRDASQGGE
jgi:hypothetical protein